MNEIYKPNIEIRNSFDNELKNIIDWAENNTQGAHNFLRIVTDALNPELLELIQANGYRVVYFNDINEPNEQKALEELLIDAQRVKETTDNKVAMIVSKKVRAQVGRIRQVQDTWTINTQYLTAFED